MKAYTAAMVAQKEVNSDDISNKLSEMGIQTSRIDKLTVVQSKMLIPISLADTFQTLLSKKKSYIELNKIHMPLCKCQFGNGAIARFGANIDSKSIMWLDTAIHVGGIVYIVYTTDTMNDWVEEKILIRCIDSIVYHLSIQIVEDPADGPPLFYHFYERNRHVGSAYGKASAEVLLEERKYRWGQYNNNCWSDDGDIEASLSPLAPISNYSGDMERWQKQYPGWLHIGRGS